MVEIDDGMWNQPINWVNLWWISQPSTDMKAKSDSIAANCAHSFLALFFWAKEENTKIKSLSKYGSRLVKKWLILFC